MASEDDDPLQIKQLALAYDYLMFKIKNHIAKLSERTLEAVAAEDEYVSHEYLEKQLNLGEEYARIDNVLRGADVLEQDFLKLEQLIYFVEDFKGRVEELENKHNDLLSSKY